MTEQTDFEKKLAQQLRSTETETQAADLFRLAQGRNRALSQGKATSFRLSWPAAGATLASIIMFAVLLPDQPSTDQDRPLISGVSTEQLAVSDPIELYQDLDFYYWLADIDEGDSF